MAQTTPFNIVAQALAARKWLQDAAKSLWEETSLLSNKPKTQGDLASAILPGGPMVGGMTRTLNKPLITNLDKEALEVLGGLAQGTPEQIRKYLDAIKRAYSRGYNVLPEGEYGIGRPADLGRDTLPAASTIPRKLDDGSRLIPFYGNPKAYPLFNTQNIYPRLVETRGLNKNGETPTLTSEFGLGDILGIPVSEEKYRGILGINHEPRVALHGTKNFGSWDKTVNRELLGQLDDNSILMDYYRKQIKETTGDQKQIYIDSLRNAEKEHSNLLEQAEADSIDSLRVRLQDVGLPNPPHGFFKGVYNTFDPHNVARFHGTSPVGTHFGGFAEANQPSFVGQLAQEHAKGGYIMPVTLPKGNAFLMKDDAHEWINNYLDNLSETGILTNPMRQRIDEFAEDVATNQLNRATGWRHGRDEAVREGKAVGLGKLLLREMNVNKIYYPNLFEGPESHVVRNSIMLLRGGPQPRSILSAKYDPRKAMNGDIFATVAPLAGLGLLSYEMFGDGQGGYTDGMQR